MKLKTLSLIAFIIFSNAFAQLDLDNLNIINDNYKIYDYVLSDIDNNGFKDLVSSGFICDRVGSSQTIIVWQANDNYGNFGIRNILYTGQAGEIDSKDIDNDGDNDIVFASGNVINVIKNNNNGTFSNVESFPLSTNGISDFYLMDMDNDSYVDIVYRDYWGVIKIKWNLTNGQFGNSNNTYGSSDLGYKIIDINNDDLPDFVFNNNTYFRFKLNQGNRIFNIGESFYISYGNAFDLGDFNNDNQKDLIVSSGGTLKIYYNQAIASPNNMFDSNNNIEIFSDGNINFTGIELADFNNDTFLDIAFNSSGSSASGNNLILENNNNIDFLNQYQFEGPSNTPEASDLNNDGLLDLFVFNPSFFYGNSGHYSTFSINNGNFDFQFQNYSNSTLKSTHTIADINNDNLKDIISFSYEDGYGYEIQYLINQGQDKFSRRAIALETPNISIRTNVKPLIFDMDNDNLKDIILIGNDNDSVDKILWIKNLGNDSFASVFSLSETGFYIIDPDKTKMFYGDFDNDNDNDLFLSYQFYENVNGVFQNATSFNTDGSHSAQHIFNSDNNSTINIIATKITIVGIDKYMSVKWFKYDSQGNLTSTNNVGYYDIGDYFSSASSNPNINNFTFIDFDNDGDKDIIYSLSCESLLCAPEFYILKNNGNDSFDNPDTLIPRTSFIDEGRSTDIEIVDIDNDNDVDIIETSYKENTSYDTTRSKIHFNDNGSFNRTETLFSYAVQNKCEELKIEISIEDMDNDGVLDLLKCNPYEYLIAGLDIYDSSLSIEENEFESQFNIYPNPTSDYIHIESKFNIALLTVYNQKGQLILENKNENKINISKLNEGLYFLKIIDKNGYIQTKKIIKN
ncbi:T9SS type A sorting domain-containing protein [Subsaximicrobium wynnwilliamsii]|uniref:T9SS type A sorting domain-containing protein n=1 Tax=Subsaximicrobium wynnwilliamsii TaxID=291179 RepID=A0A5C6ZCL4_9FLAO|nr:T9SS type A sorting domain-containing protein [Subsaximicrobium wynnwilliamsii]TXD80700.1 T9SS type A sorting domain-containing protein [Subsaximicrobium wynnwilliamsii]TXD86405.1 T9SS type A sorting domain-containing protein [Subsaximicrobium wynnwilliamsii]TXD99923.1 T9SS type A sorting domain-containing protein [Subsaximicrobium wynnwilliamsii]